MTVEHISYTHPFRSLNQARDIADKYARASGQTMFVVFQSDEFYVTTGEELSSFFDEISDNEIRYCTAGIVS